MAGKWERQEANLDNNKVNFENDTCIALLIEENIKEGVFDGTIASVAWYTACTSNAGMIGEPDIQTSQPSAKVFSVSYGRHTPGENISKQHHSVREPAWKVDMVPAPSDKSLLSGRNISEARYISICNGEEVNIYDGRTAKIMVSESAVMKGWRCPCTNMW